MVILGKVINSVPTFKLSIVFYSFLQFLMVLYFVNSLKLKSIITKNLILISIVFNTFYLLSSVELWSQFFAISLNFYSLGLIFKEIDKDKNFSVYKLLLICIILSSFYLGGILNSVSAFVIIIFLKISNKIKLSYKFKPFYFSLVIFLVTFIWIPLLLNLKIKDLFINSDSHNFIFSFNDIIKTFFFNYYDEPFVLHSDYETFSILILRTRTLLRIANFSFSILFTLIILLLVYDFVFKKYKLEISYKPKVIFSFIFIYYILSPLLGGPNFFVNERIDMELQFYFLFISGVLITTFEIIQKLKFSNLFYKLLNLSLFAFLTINVIYTAMLYNHYLNYNGYLISNSDVPLKYKLEVVEYIYRDAVENEKILDNTIRIYYDLAGTNFEWINEFGEYYPHYYESPYTIGRIFDLVFLKEFKIFNNQEGIQHRSFLGSDYIVTYRYNDNFESISKNIREIKEINRFRIYILENN